MQPHPDANTYAQGHMHARKYSQLNLSHSHSHTRTHTLTHVHTQALTHTCCSSADEKRGAVA